MKAVVTGSASGIGAAVRERLEQSGYEVVGVDLRGEEVCGDLSLPNGRDDAIYQILRDVEGPIEVVVTCAGIRRPARRAVAVNFFGSVKILTGLHARLAAASHARAIVLAAYDLTQPVATDLVQACLDEDEPRATMIATSLLPDVAYASSKRALAAWVRRNAPGPKWLGEGITLTSITDSSLESLLRPGPVGSLLAR